MRRPPGTMRPVLIRALLALACAVLVLGSARAASAAVPLCDVRGASGIAPAPVLPVRDARIDGAGPATGSCQDEPASGIALRSGRSGPSAPEGHEAAPGDTATVGAPTPFPRNAPFPGRRAHAARHPLPAAHAPGVYHPPRT
jgi:hypothetical protein